MSKSKTANSKTKGNETKSIEVQRLEAQVKELEEKLNKLERFYGAMSDEEVMFVNIQKELIRSMVRDGIREAMQTQAHKKGLMTDPKWANTKQAMEILMCSETELYRIRKRGEIPPHAVRRFGKRWQYSIEWLNTNTGFKDHQEAPVKA